MKIKNMRRLFCFMFVAYGLMFLLCYLSPMACDNYLSTVVVGIDHEIMDEGFYPLNEAMASAGYLSKDVRTFCRSDFGKSIVIKFDFENNICMKNDYLFSLKDKYVRKRDTYYLKVDFLNLILNGSIKYDGGKFEFISVAYKPHEWAEHSRLIAHAGGAVRGTHCNDYYTNSREALVQNYNLGHRVFEFDFYLTSDNKLAAVHDWKGHGARNGRFLSAKEFKSVGANGRPLTKNRFSTMMIDDILDEMIVNKDMFIVTDTKSTEFTDAQIRLQFKLIYDAAMRRSPELLGRIIPQVYNDKTYNIVTSIYKFPSIIFTTYACNYTDKQIFKFLNNKKNIRVVTMYKNDKRLTPQFVKTVHNMGLKLYTHSSRSYSEIAEQKAKGIDGLYVEFILPFDLWVYEYVLSSHM